MVFLSAGLINSLEVQCSLAASSDRVTMKPYGKTHEGRTMVRLFERGCHLRAAMKSFEVGGHRYQRGAIVLRGHENPANLGQILRKLAREFDVTIRPAQTASVGAVWHLLDYRLKMRVSPVERTGDLRKYNVLILPGGGFVSDDVKKWIADGGTLIAFGRAAYAIAKEGSGVSSVRRRRDVYTALVNRPGGTH